MRKGWRGPTGAWEPGGRAGPTAGGSPPLICPADRSGLCWAPIPAGRPRTSPVVVRDGTMRGTRLALLALVLASCGGLGERPEGARGGRVGGQERKKVGGGGWRLA